MAKMYVLMKLTGNMSDNKTHSELESMWEGNKHEKEKKVKLGKGDQECQGELVVEFKQGDQNWPYWENSLWTQTWKKWGN